jgi:hypothetical protein
MVKLRSARHHLSEVRLSLPKRTISDKELLKLRIAHTVAQLDLLQKSIFSCRGEASADKNPDFTDKSGRKCFALLGFMQEVY